MKKFSAKTVISVMSFTLFALLLLDSYLDHKQDIDESIARLKTTLTPQPTAEEPVVETTANTEPTGETEYVQHVVDKSQPLCDGEHLKLLAMLF